MDNDAANAIRSLRVKKLVVACLSMFAIGIIYGWSVISAPIADEFQWEPATLAFSFTLLMWVFSISGFFSARIAQATSVRVSLSLSALFILIAFFSTTVFVTADAPWVLYITYSLFAGLGVGFAYTVTIGAGVAWFPERVGVVTGALLLCYGVSTMALSSAAAWLFSVMNWRVAFPILGTAMAILLICGAVVLRWPTDEERALLPKPVAAETDETGQRRSYTSSEMLRTPVFWTYVCWMIIISVISLGITSIANQIALEAGALPAIAVAIVGVFSIGNGVSRLLGGVVFDALGTFRTILGVAICAGVAMLGIAISLTMGLVPLVAVSLVLVSVALGGMAVCGSSYCAVTFGPRYYASNLAILNWATIPASLIGPMIFSFSVSTTGSYSLGATIGAVLAVVAVVFACITGRLLKRR